MSFQLIVFPTPLDASCRLTPDAGPPLIGVPVTHSTGRPGQGFTIPDGTPNGHGSTLEIAASGKTPLRQRGILWLGTPWGAAGQAAFQADDFTLTTGVTRLPPFDLDGRFPRLSDGTELVINEATGFRAFHRFLTGDFRTLDAFCADLHACRFNFVRTMLMMDTTLYLADPRLRFRLVYWEHPDFFEQLPLYCSYLADFSLYPSFVACAQTQTLLPDPAAQRTYVQRLETALHDWPGLLSKVNENDQHDNRIDDSVIAMPKPVGARFILSNGSNGSDAFPVEPVAQAGEYHSNDLNEWQRKAGHNSWEYGNLLNCAMWPSENTRFGDKETNLQFTEDAGKTIAAMVMGGTFHSPEGKNAEPFSAFVKQGAQRWSKGMFDGGVLHRRGFYQHLTNLEGPQPDGSFVIRGYSMTGPGPGSYVWQVHGEE